MIWQDTGSTDATEPVVIRTCDVCVLVDGDYSAKPVRWCQECSAWICNACWPNYFRRAQAMMKRAWAQTFGR